MIVYLQIIGLCYLIFSAVESKRKTPGILMMGYRVRLFTFQINRYVFLFGIMLTRVKANPAECDIHDDQSSFRLMRDPYSSLEVLRC